MGKCIKCGNETPNSYNYYSAIVDSKTGYMRDSKSISVATHLTTVTKYSDIQEHFDYYCSKCLFGGNRTLYILAVFLMVAAIITSIITYNLSKQFSDTIGVFCFIAIFPLILFFIGKSGDKKVKNNERSTDGKVNQTIVDEKNRGNSGYRIFFTPSHYQIIKELEAQSERDKWNI